MKMESGDATKLKQLDENWKLKHVVAELTLDNRALKDVNFKKLLSACGTLGSRELHDGGVSVNQRNACRLMELARSMR